ncbi:MAG TPA: protein kinase [Terracidiphilus sp.]|nr:protein kinase [Terracidiphilus sp.]
MDKSTPERIGKYEIVDVLGQGGMGVVYRARDPRIGRNVAIKTLTEGFSGESDMLQRFYQEAGHTGNLRHPNIVTVYDFGDENGLPYIVMEFLDGQPLDKIIRDKEPLHLGEKLDIIEQVCAALDYAHAQGMIHRDVKPANIIVQRDGLVKLLDFGIARTGQQPTDKNMTRTGTLVGTPAYMAPERLRGDQFDGRSDIFSTGVVLYQLLTGVLPFDAEYPAILHQILQQDPPPLGNYLTTYPAQLDQAIARALAKEPIDRYGRAGDMAADLNAIGAHIKLQRIAQLLLDAQKASDAQDYAQAKLLLTQILRMDSQNAEAKKLMAVVDQFFNLQRLRQRVEQLNKSAREAIEGRNWDQAIAVCTEAVQLDAENSEAAELLARASAGKQTRETIQQLMRDADSARHAGNYDTAQECAAKARDLDPTDSRIMAICKVLQKEADEARLRARVQKLLQATQDSLNASRFIDASSAIAEAESLAPSDPELLRLKDELAEAIRQEERMRLVGALQEKTAGALTLEELQSAMGEVTEALEKFPSEPTLLRLKIQVAPRLRELENKRLVAEVSDACRQLPPAEALTRVREALSHLPGSAELIKLESAIAKRLARQQKERSLAEYMARARALLEDHLYLETVKVLEQCERDGFSSPQLTELLELARSAASERISQDLVERSFLEAKRLLEEQDYEEVMRLLEPVLQRVDEPALRRLLEEATLKQRAREEQVDRLLAEVERYCALHLFDAAAGLIRAEPGGVMQVKRVQAALKSCTEQLDAEAARLEAIGAFYATLSGNDCAAAFQRLARAGGATSASTAGIEQRLASRVQLIADQQVTKNTEAARQALTSEDAALANSLLQDVSAWQANCSPSVQAEWKAAQSDVAAAKKVLRFRKVLRR